MEMGFEVLTGPGRTTAAPERQDEEALRIPGPRPGSKHVPAATSLWTCFPICKMGLLFKL